MKRKKLLVISTVLLLLALLLPPFLRWQNDGLTVSRYEFRSAEVDEALDGYVIVQLSDLQDKCFGTDQAPLVKEVAALKPDLILLTGDMVDYNKFNEFNLATTLTLMRGVTQIAPCYFTTGNHETAFSNEKLQEILDDFAACGVRVLLDEYTWIERDDGRFCLFGLGDHLKLSETWAEAVPQEDGLCLMLAHRPERIEQYTQGNVDLIFSGHAHGGQVRLPLIGGLYAPEQGWFPKLTAGMHEKNGVTMVISRGLGNSEFPQRLFNRPEIVQVTLRAAK